MDLPSRPGEHPPSERRGDIGLPKDEPAVPRPAPEEKEPDKLPRM